MGRWLSYFNAQFSAVPQKYGVYATMASTAPTVREPWAFGGYTDNLLGRTKDDIDSGMLRAAGRDGASMRSALVVTNPQAPNIAVSAPITITGIYDPEAAAPSAAGQLG